MRTALIYRSRLLPISETFVRQHYESLDRYRPVFAGLRKVEGIDIDDADAILLEEGRRSPAAIGAFLATGYAPRFLGRIAERKPDLIHAHFAVDAVEMLPVARRLGIPLVVTLHGYDVTYTDAAFRRMGPQGWNFLARRRKLFQKADLFLAVSDFIREKALLAGAPAARTHTHYLGIDLDRFPPPSPERRNTVLYVGRLVEKKGLNLLITALAKAGANEKGIGLRVVGDGPLRSAFEAQAKAQLKDVVFLGARPHAQVIEELGMARIFCLPSLAAASGDNEGLPISLLEAQASGVPVVSFAQGGILEAVVDGETGLLATPGDVDGLSQCLNRMIADEHLCLGLGTAGRERMQKLFDVRMKSRDLQQRYDDLLTARVRR